MLNLLNCHLSFEYAGKPRTGNVVKQGTDYVTLRMGDEHKTFNLSKITSNITINGVKVINPKE